MPRWHTTVFWELLTLGLSKKGLWAYRFVYIVLQPFFALLSRIDNTGCYKYKTKLGGNRIQIYLKLES